MRVWLCCWTSLLLGKINLPSVHSWMSPFRCVLQCELHLTILAIFSWCSNFGSSRSEYLTVPSFTKNKIISKLTLSFVGSMSLPLHISSKRRLFRRLLSYSAAKSNNYALLISNRPVVFSHMINRHYRAQLVIYSSWTMWTNKPRRCGANWPIGKRISKRLPLWVTSCLLSLSVLSEIWCKFII